MKVKLLVAVLAASLLCPVSAFAGTLSSLQKGIYKEPYAPFTSTKAGAEVSFTLSENIRCSSIDAYLWFGYWAKATTTTNIISKTYSNYSHQVTLNTRGGENSHPWYIAVNCLREDTNKWETSVYQAI